MKLFAAAAVLASVLPLVSASPVAATEVRQEQTLAAWWNEAPFTIFPNHTGWEASFDKVFAPNLTATFNYATHDFTSLKNFFTGVYGVVSTKYEYLRIAPQDAVVLPNSNDKGGLVYMTGKETGVLKGGTTVREERDAVFAVIKEVNGERKVTEWRETTLFF